MRILMLHNFYQQPGGEDECFAAETALLREHGHQVDHFVLHNDDVAALGMARVAAKTIWNRQAYGMLRAQIRDERPDLVHAQNLFPLISPAAFHAARAEGVPVVQSIHNYRLFCTNGLFYRDGKPCEDCIGRAIPWPGVARRCYRDSALLSGGVAAMIGVHRALGTWRHQVDRFIALTQFARSKLIAAGIPDAKIAVKPNFLSVDPGVGGDARGGFVLFAGRLSQEKGVATLAEAWRHVPGPLRLRIVGDGPLAGELAALAAQDPRIELVGRRPLREVQEMMRDASVVAVPSECYETFGRVVVESFAAGTPVLASRIGAIAELLTGERTGRLFQPGDPVDLARRLAEILADPDAHRRMGRAARAEFLAHYTAEANYRSIMGIYQDVLDSTGRVPQAMIAAMPDGHPAVGADPGQ